MKILVLDDSKERLQTFRRKLIGHEAVLVETASEAIAQLNTNSFDICYLDHDLGGKHMVPSGKGTGYEVAKWLSERPEKQPRRIIIHSFNPEGSRAMASCLPNAKVIPGAWSYDIAYSLTISGV